MSTNETPSLAGPVVDIPTDFSHYQGGPPTAVKNPDNPPWGILQAALTWLASIFLLALVPLVTALPYLIYHSRAYGHESAELLLADKNFIFFSVLGVIPAHMLTLALAWAIVTNMGRYPFWRTLGWDWAPEFGPWRSVGLAVVLFGVGVVVTYFVGGKETQLDQLINSSYQTRVTMAFLAVATGPLVEEIIYRGLLYAALQRAIGVVGAVVLVSIMFAGVHFLQYRSNLGVIGVISLLSISLTLVRARTGRLLPSFVIHLVFNGIQSVLLMLQPFLERSQQVTTESALSNLATLIARHFV